MWQVKVINWITNVFGGVAGMSEILEGIALIQSDQIPHGIGKLLIGSGIAVIGYFTGKSAMKLEPK
jgi:hypothetical protein